MLIAFNKPWGVLCQFSPSAGRPTLADFIDLPEVYPAGRLDRDSEGLLLLTDDGQLQHAIAAPQAQMTKRYWAQVEGEISDAALARLERGVVLNDGLTRPATARRLAAEPAGLWPRVAPIRVRQSIPTSWIELVIAEGRNRQVRRMSAAVGHPTLRLIRSGIGALCLATLDLPPGRWRQIDALDLGRVAPASRRRR